MLIIVSIHSLIINSCNCRITSPTSDHYPT